MEITTIWDGWTTQITGILEDEQGGFCAMGYAKYRQEGVSLATRREIAERVNAVGRYIQRSYNIPAEYVHPIERSVMYPQKDSFAAVVYANNELHISPERFRAIDEYLQIQAVLNSIEPQLLVAPISEGVLV